MNKRSKKLILSEFMQKVWNEGDFSSLARLVAPRYHVSKDAYDPWSDQVIGHETFKKRVLYSRDAFPDLNFDIREMIEENDRVAVNWVMSGTHLGDLALLPATGRKFSIEGMRFYAFKNVRLCGHTQSFDQVGFLKQMGIFGPPA
ncbi:MAG: ester cyclase [Lysobacterales bacterium]